MDLTVVAVGEAGGRILDRLYAYEERNNSDIIHGGIAVNTAKADLARLSHVPESGRVLLGREQVKGHGVGTDNELGAEVMEADLETVTSAIEAMGVQRSDAVLVTAALGGGTGSGGAPILSEHIRDRYDPPVYALGLLPTTEEGPTHALNAIQSFRTLASGVDGLVLFDNEAWVPAEEPVVNHYDKMNETLVRRITGLFRSDGRGAQATLTTENVEGLHLLAVEDVAAVLTGGGIASIGRASDAIPAEPGSGGLLSGLFSSGAERDITDKDLQDRLERLVRQATLGQLTIATDFDQVERALVIITGPPVYLDADGMDAGRDWVTERIGGSMVRTGFVPLPGHETLSATVLFAGIAETPRIEELRQTAAEVSDERKGSRATDQGRLEVVENEAVEETDSETETLF